ncbi:MAG: tetratricopeptide repeat protein [Desulfovibrio desulfuricans]|nr:tetratricopeptide repeat protein [Desulfovibrio desulfuricans]
MKNLALLLCCTWGLAGCGPTIYQNSDPSANWAQDSFVCQEYAEGSTPMPQYVPIPQSRTETGYGTVHMNNGRTAHYDYTHTYHANPYDQANAHFYNASQDFARMSAVQRRFERCLNSLGWFEVKKGKELTLVDADYLNPVEDFPDTKEEVEKCKTLANQGNTKAQVSLGMAYLYGRGLYAPTIAESKKQAYAWFTQAALQGNEVAKYELGKGYLDGEDIPKDKERGMQLIKESAAQGYQPAIDAISK